MNKREYKKAFSGVQPSNEAVERIMDMNTKNKLSFNSVFKRTASAFMALALIIGGGFGVNYAVSKSNSNNELGVIVAYAGDKGNLTFGGKSEQEIFYGIYLASVDDEKACREASRRWQADTNELINQLDNISDNSYGNYGRGSFPCYSKNEGRVTAEFYTLEGGSFELDLEDYSNVKSFKVNNESEYGILQFEYASEKTEQFSEEYSYMCDENYVASDEELEEVYAKYPELDLHKHEFNLTGDEIRYSQDVEYGKSGVGKYETNKGYFLLWCPSEELTYAIGDNPDFDLSQIKDTITFTVEFNDGTVKTASLNLYFDSDGYMHFEK